MLNTLCRHPATRFGPVRLLRRLAVAVLCMLFPFAAETAAQPSGPSQPIIYEHADSLIGRVENGEMIQTMEGNVALSQGVTRITADKGTRWESSNRAVLTGNVRITQPGLVLTAPRVEYDGNSKMALTPSGVTIKDSGATLQAATGQYDIGRRIAYFRNGVTLRDDKAVLRASSGEYHSLDLKAMFRGNVTVENDSGSIRSDQLTYWRATQESYSIGGVVLTAPYQGTQLFGDTLHNQPARRYTIALGSPKLIRIDTAAAADSAGAVRRDTTVIVARKMEAFREGREEYVATDSVRLDRGGLRAIGTIARFLPKEDIIAIGPGRARPAVESVPADTSGAVDTTAVTGKPPTVATEGEGRADNPIVWYEDSQLTGDTITVGLLERRLHAIDVMGSAFAVTAGKSPERFDQLAGGRLLFDITADTIRRIQSEGYASSIYFLYEEDQPNGASRASGDTITVSFSAGQVDRVKVAGERTQQEGDVIPEQNIAGQEQTYRLDGFRWYTRDGVVVSSPTAPPVDSKVKAPDASSEGSRARPRSPQRSDPDHQVP